MEFSYVDPPPGAATRSPPRDLPSPLIPQPLPAGRRSGSSSSQRPRTAGLALVVDLGRRAGLGQLALRPGVHPGKGRRGAPGPDRAGGDRRRRPRPPAARPALSRHRARKGNGRTAPPGRPGRGPPPSRSPPRWAGRPRRRGAPGGPDLAGADGGRTGTLRPLRRAEERRGGGSPGRTRGRRAPRRQRAARPRGDHVPGGGRDLLPRRSPADRRGQPSPHAGSGRLALRADGSSTPGGDRIEVVIDLRATELTFDGPRVGPVAAGSRGPRRLRPRALDRGDEAPGAHGGRRHPGYVRRGLGRREGRGGREGRPPLLGVRAGRRRSLAVPGGRASARPGAATHRPAPVGKPLRPGLGVGHALPTRRMGRAGRPRPGGPAPGRAGGRPLVALLRFRVDPHRPRSGRGPAPHRGGPWQPGLRPVPRGSPVPRPGRHRQRGRRLLRPPRLRLPGDRERRRRP